MRVRGERIAFGAPGLSPKWSHSNKDGLGTAYSADSRLWYTLWRGTITEVYFPTIDRPQLRDLELLFTDGSTFFHEEKRDLVARTERVSEDALAFRVHSEAPDGHYHVRKTVIGDPHLPCLLLRVRVDVDEPGLIPQLRAYVLAAPHLNVSGSGNNASVQEILGQSVLLADKAGVAMAVGCTQPFSRTSVGYVGASDGWTDVSEHRALTWEFDQAPDGNVALTGEIPLGAASNEFTLGVAFGETSASAVTSLFQSLGTPFETHERRFLAQWRRSAHGDAEEPKPTHPGALYHVSRCVLLAHEDKTYPGAFVASLSIPWGASKGDEDRGGYHLVWVRDLFHAATGLLATGITEAPLRALIYLASRQQPDGGFPQNFWIDGDSYWQGLQLDEVAFPVLLAGALYRADGLHDFDPTPMVRAAAHFLVQHGPVTEQDRWEEVSGYSPSTLATCIAALTTAAGFLERAGDAGAAEFVQEYADFLESHLERWTVTDRGTLLPGVPRHFVRIRPAAVDDPSPDEGPDLGTVNLPNLEPGAPRDFPAAEVVDGGFVDLVRLGIRRADDPLIRNSVRVIDAVLGLSTPAGRLWHRYNHDGYGETPEGAPYLGWGVGRAWPLLTGERGHYELAQGHDPTPYLRTLEKVATSTGLLPEQVWDEADRPALHLSLGRPTESATPLVWAHAEYLKLARSAHDGAVFDRVPEVAERYLDGTAGRRQWEVWKFGRQPRSMERRATLRIVAGHPFRLHASAHAWARAEDHDSAAPALGFHYVDLPPPEGPSGGWVFTFQWLPEGRWEGRDYEVRFEDPTPAGPDRLTRPSASDRK